MKNRNFSLLLFLNLLLLLEAFGQIDRSPLLKVGVFPYFNNSEYTGFSAHLEFERAIKRKEFLTLGPRLDLISPKGSINKNLFVGYELKFYPFYWKSHKPYQGIFIGIDPLLLVRNNNYSMYGPGLGSLLGYQHLFGNKMSLAFEGSTLYMQNLNDEVRAEHGYYFLFAALKIGIKL